MCTPYVLPFISILWLTFLQQVFLLLENCSSFTWSLRVKVLDFEKEGEFKEEKEYDRINKVMLVITVEQNI